MLPSGGQKEELSLKVVNIDWFEKEIDTDGICLQRKYKLRIRGRDID